VKRSFILALAAVASITVAGIAQAATPLQFKLSAQNGSGETGTATLVQSGDDVIVKVHLDGAPSDVPQPAHIHMGTCAKLNPKPTYPLHNVVDGTSETTVQNVKLSDLTSGTFAINVHKSTSDLGTYVACGDLKVSTGGM
jgi:hypothetical protein